MGSKYGSVLMLGKNGHSREKTEGSRRLPFPIDVVITYVDGSVPGFVAEYQDVVGVAPLPNQIRTLGELRYVFRSVEKALPNARRVYLVVHDLAQVPDWIDPDQVQLVTHRDFIPSRLLPTFSPCVIQAHLYRIEGLSEHFVVWSDDKFARDVCERDFFSKTGTPQLHANVCWWLPRVRPDQPAFTRRLANTRALVERKFSESKRDCDHALYPHAPVPVRKSWWCEMLDDFTHEPDFVETIESSARDSRNAIENRVTVMELWVDWALLARARTWRIAKYVWRLLNRARMRLARYGLARPRAIRFTVRNDPTHSRAQMERLLKLQPFFFNVNDEANDQYGDWSPDNFDIHPESQTVLSGALEHLFPMRSRFERREKIEQGHSARLE